MDEGPPAETFRLDDGRRLAYTEYGDPAGHPVFYAHGGPGSRLEGRLFDEAARQHGFRLIATDRPGMGRSDFHPQRGVLDHPRQIEALADHLGLDRFGVLGWSGGGAFTVACAHALPHRLSFAITCAGYTNFGELPDAASQLRTWIDRWAVAWSRSSPRLFDGLFRALELVVRRAPTPFVRSLIRTLNPADRAILADEELQSLMVADQVEAFASGHRGPAHDALLHYHPWGFPLADVSIPVHILHGTEDRLVPLAFAEHLAVTIPTAVLHRLPGRGHWFPAVEQDAIFGLAARLVAGEPPSEPGRDLRSEEVGFRREGVWLAGTLLAPPTGTAATALLISGSGRLDRDSNIKRQRVDVMRQVAEHLAGDGIASYRYDKRGVGASGGDYHATGFHDNVADADAALTMLADHPSVDRAGLFVVGHSEGALIATEVAADHPELAGVVLLAGMAQRGEDVLRWQGRRVAETLPRPIRRLLRLLRVDLVAIQRKRLAQLEATERDVERIQLVKVNAKWFREFLAHDPAPALARITVPVLAVTGIKDIQVDPADVGRMRELVPGEFTGQVPPDLTHLLRTDLGPPSIRSYRAQLRRPTDPGLLASVAGWVTGRAGASS